MPNCNIFSLSGVSWTRYTNGSSCQKYSSATVWLAASINSSIILCAPFLSYSLISKGFPFASSIILLSGKSKSTEPFLNLLFLKISATSYISANIGINSLYFSRSSLSSSSIILFTLVYDILLSTLIIVSSMLWPVISPAWFISIIHERASLSSPWLSEHIPLESLCGSIGITLSTR